MLFPSSRCWKMSDSVSPYSERVKISFALLYFSIPGATFNSPSRLFFALTDSRTECSSPSSSPSSAAGAMQQQRLLIISHSTIGEDIPSGLLTFFIYPLQRFLLPIKFYPSRILLPSFSRFQRYPAVYFCVRIRPNNE